MSVNREYKYVEFLFLRIKGLDGIYMERRSKNILILKCLFFIVLWEFVFLFRLYFLHRKTAETLIGKLARAICEQFSSSPHFLTMFR